jgi:hypothetical protein
MSGARIKKTPALVFERVSDAYLLVNKRATSCIRKLASWMMTVAQSKRYALRSEVLICLDISPYHT